MAEAAIKSKRRSGVGAQPLHGADAPLTLPDDDLDGAGMLAQHLTGAFESIVVAVLFEGLEGRGRSVLAARIE
ncbi:hypothetical protein [Phenylobacterium sp.]|uniref:hypothetical protein n=1 Tax=Phenylobacterium sp. TaxID=1871053 RepID=UPI0012067A9D|nr:hypothetical protein [Phenylobacterium sp.]TAL33101.1 MAG: hypothetical protein EPN98_12100 [Phenylobacterium sp.]